MKKRSLILVAGIIGIAAVAAYITRSSWMGGNASAQGPQRPRMVSVELAKAERKSVPVDVDAIGMVTPISSVALKSRVETTIVSVHFEDGAKVAEGDLLFTLDSRQIDAQDPKVLTIGSVHGGNRFNIIADQVTLEGTMRTLDPAVRTAMKERIQRAVNGVAAANGVTASLRFVGEGNEATLNEPGLTRASVPSLQRVYGAARLIFLRREGAPAGDQR